MSYSSETVIEQSNRNEAKEAIAVINKVTSDSLEIAFTKIKNILGEHNPKTFSVETLEAIEAVNQIRHELFEAKRLIEKFSDKHQPKLSRWK